MTAQSLKHEFIDGVYQISTALQAELGRYKDANQFPPPFKIPSVSSKVQVVMGTETGKSVVATAPIAAGEIIVHADGTRISRPLRYSWQIGKGVHMVGSGLVDHHCVNPTCVVDFDTGDIIGARDLEPGERITLNYMTTEYAMTSHFICKCGEVECYGQMQGYKYLSAEQRCTLKEQLEVAPYLLEGANN